MRTNSLKKIILLVAILVIILFAAMLIWHKRSASSANNSPVTTGGKAVKIATQQQPTIGNPKAKVHIVAFEDLKCGNCMRFNTTLLPIIKRKYIDTGIARYTMINLAFIPGSMPAANAARCIYVQNDKLFFKFVDYIYDHQPPENQNWATLPKLLEMAQNIKGINLQDLKACMVTAKYNSVINDNFKIATQVMGPTVATPTIYINGLKVDPLTMDNIRHAIEQAH